MSQKGDMFSIFVTVVQPLGKVCQIWGQTDTEASHEIEILMAAAEAELVSRQPITLEAVAVGDVFLAKFHEDMKWYRATVKVVDKANRKVKVFFIDYGNEEDIDLTDIAKGEGRHFEIPPQASQFVLGEIQAKNNHEWTAIEIAGLSEQLLYGEFPAVLLNGNTVGNPRILRLFTDETESESLVTDIIAAGFGARANVCTEEPLQQTILEPNENYHVYVVFYESPLNFWIQLTNGEEMLNRLQDAIASEISDNSPGAPHVTVGTVCIAKFCDKDSDLETFYRAVVTGVHSDGTCTVLYVDYGNSEKLSLNKLKVIPPVFRELPSQAIQCCLHGSLADADQFQRMLESEEIYAQVVSVVESGLHVVKLREGIQSQVAVCPSVVPSERSGQQNISSNNNNVVCSKFKSLQFNLGKQVDLCISHVEPSGMFYCQLLENGPCLNQLMHTLDERYRTGGTPLNIPTPGTPCVTRSILDGCVYRSKILAVDNKNITVQHIDFGITEGVPPDSVLVVDADLMEIPSQSIYCSLSDSDDYSATAVANLLKRYESQTALVGAVLLKSGPVYVMELVDTSSISDVYLVKELQKPTPVKLRTSKPSYSKVKLKEGQWTDIQVTYIGDPANVFCQFVSAQEELITLMDQIQLHCLSGNTTPLAHLETDMPCLAKYSEDGDWYRASIVGVHQSTAFDVHFVDYGNHDVVPEENLRAIPPEFMMLPRQCFRGVLDGLVGASGSWIEEETTVLFEMAAEESHPTLIRKHEAHDDLYIIQIFTPTGSCINQNFGKKIKKLSPTFVSRGPPPNLCMSQVAQTTMDNSCGPISQKGGDWAQWQQSVQTLSHQHIEPLEVQPGYKNIIIETIVNPGEFYCRLTETSDALFDFMDQINNVEYLNLAPDDLRLSNPTQGMVCCAKFNNEWYRAKILSVSSLGVVVQYVDFGNTEMVPISDIKQLKPGLSKMPAQALKCSLAGVAPVGGSWSEESGTVFESILGDSQMVGAFTECGSDGTYLIEVVQAIPGGQILFHEKLIEHGIAISQESQKLAVDQVLLHGNRRRQVSNSSSSSSSSHSLHVSYRYSRPSITASQTVDVNVVHVESPSEFWVQLTQNCTELENLMSSLQDFYSALRIDQCCIQLIKPDMACVARFSEDEMWYRAEVIQDMRGELLVRYVDYGNYEKRTTSDVWEIQPDFLKLPAQAIQCSLHGVVAPPTGWAITTKDTLEDMVLDKNLLAEIVSVSSTPQILTVKLIETKGQMHDSIADQLMQLKLAVSTAPARITSRQRVVSSERTNENADAKTCQLQSEAVKKDIPPLDVAIGDSLMVNIVWANSPTSFWCQRVESQLAVLELMEALSGYYETLRMKDAQIHNPQPGQLCVALYNADGNWYRSEVLRTRNREAEVLYVDFGNKDRLPWSKLKEIMPQFLDIPQFALHCTLHGMEVFNGKYDQAVEQYFSEIMAQDLSLSVQALPKASGQPHMVVITDNEGNDVAKQMAKIGGKLPTITQPGVVSAPLAQPRALQLSRIQSEQPPVVSFPKLKIPRRDIELTVSNIETVDSFYCQLTTNTEELDSFMVTLDSHYASGTVSPLTQAEVKAELPCVVQFSEDNCWYRATVKRVISSTEVEVIFIDYGNAEVTMINKLCPVLPKFACYPVQAFQCTLSGMPSIALASALNHFRQLVEGKELLGKILDEGQKLNLELTDKMTGTNINSELISRFSCSQKEQPTTTYNLTGNFPPPQLPTGSEEVYITHVDSPASFWIQMTSQEAEVQALADSMLERYGALGQEKKLMNVTINRPCVARFSEDDAWYRGTVEKKMGDEAIVRFIDYGNTDNVKLADLKLVANDLLLVPPFAIHCRLDGITEPATGWTAEQKLTLEELKNPPVATFAPTSIETPVAVKLKADGVDVGQKIEPVVEQSVLAEVGAKYLAANVPSDEVTVHAIHIEDGFVYVHLDDQVDNLEELTEKLQDVYGTSSDDYLSLKAVKQGCACVAQFSEDDAWYRAIIESVTGQQVSVRFIDFGNGEVKTANSLKQLTTELLQKPPFALKCQLHGVLCPSLGLKDCLIDSLTDMLTNQLMDRPISARFIGTQEPYTVKLVINGGDFSQKVREVFPQLSSVSSQISTTPSEPMAVPKFPKQSVAGRKRDPQTAFVSHLEDPHCIFLQFDADSNQLEHITDVLQKRYGCMTGSQMPVLSPEVGAACVAKFSDDDAWYRAVIEASNPEITVRFIDFGNAETMTSESLKQLTPDLLAQPALAFKCCLYGVEMPPLGWPDGLKEKLNSLIMDQELQAVFLADESPFPVEIVVGEIHVSIAVREIVNPSIEDKKVPSTISTVEVPFKESGLEDVELPESKAMKIGETAYVSTVESPSLFYIQKESEADALDGLMEQVSTSCASPSPLTHPTAGQLCCAKYNEDGAWYRAVITNVEENIHVQFCDYGNTATVKISDLQLLQGPLRNVPAFAIAFQLIGSNSVTWTAEQTDQFIEMTTDKELIVKELEQGTSPPSIRLFEGDVDLNLAMGCVPLSTTDIESEDFQDVSEQMEQVSQEQLVENRTSESAGSPVVSSKENESTDMLKKPLESDFQEDTDDAEVSQVIAASTTEELSESSELSNFQEAADEMSANFEKLALATTSDRVTTEGSVGDLSSEFSEEFTDAPSEEDRGTGTIEELSKSKAEEVTGAIEVSHQDLASNRSQESADSEEFQDIVPIGEHSKENEVVDIITEASESEFQDTEVEVTQEMVKKDTINDPANEFQGFADEVGAGFEKLTIAMTSDSRVTAEDVEVDLSSETSEEFTDAIDEVEDHVALKPGDRIEVQVTHIKSPSQFWCVRVDAKNECNSTLAAVAECCENGTAPGDVAAKQIYGARHTDNEWCRISVTAVDDEQVGAFFIDYGNTEKVYKSDLRPLPLFLKKTPGFAVPCLLHGVKSSEDVWTEKAILCFEELSLDKILLAEIIGVGSKAQMYIVKLLDMGISVAEKLIEKSHAVKSDAPAYELDSNKVESPESEAQSPEKSEEYTYRDLDQAKSTLFFPEDEDTVEVDISTLQKSMLKDGERAEILISHINSFDSIFIQLKRQQSILRELVDEMQEAYDAVSDEPEEFKATIKPGLVCAAQSLEDDLWYRAHVLDASESDNVVSVQFLDYGNTETLQLNTLKPLKPKFHTQPQQSINCRVHSSEGLSTNIFDSFVVEVHGKTLLAEVEKILENDTPSLKLLDMGTCVLSHLTSGDIAQVTAAQEIDVLKNQSYNDETLLEHLPTEKGVLKKEVINRNDIPNTTQDADVQDAEENDNGSFENESPAQFMNVDEAVIEQNTLAMTNLNTMDKIEEEIPIIQSHDTEENQTADSQADESGGTHATLHVQIVDFEDVQLPEKCSAATSDHQTLEDCGTAAPLAAVDKLNLVAEAFSKDTKIMGDDNEEEADATQVFQMDSDCVQLAEMCLTASSEDHIIEDCSTEGPLAADNKMDLVAEVIHEDAEIMGNDSDEETATEDFQIDSEGVHLQEKCITATVEDHAIDNFAIGALLAAGGKMDLVVEVIREDTKIMGNDSDEEETATEDFQIDPEGVHLAEKCIIATNEDYAIDNFAIGAPLAADGKMDLVAEIICEDAEIMWNDSGEEETATKDFQIVDSKGVHLAEKCIAASNEDHAIDNFAIGAPLAADGKMGLVAEVFSEDANIMEDSNDEEETAATQDFQRADSEVIQLPDNCIAPTSEDHAIGDCSTEASLDSEGVQLAERCIAATSEDHTIEESTEAALVADSKMIICADALIMADDNDAATQDFQIDSEGIQLAEKCITATSADHIIEDCHTEGSLAGDSKMGLVAEVICGNASEDHTVEDCGTVTPPAADGKGGFVDDVISDDDEEVAQKSECTHGISIDHCEEVAEKSEFTSNINMDDHEEASWKSGCTGNINTDDSEETAKKSESIRNINIDDRTGKTTELAHENESDMQSTGEGNQFLTVTDLCQHTGDVHIHYPCFSVAQELYVTASVTNSPYDFWCQLVQPSTIKLPLLSDRIQDYCSANPTSDTLIDNLHSGMPCFAQCSLDGNWYRGVIQDVRGDSVDVCYIDYGNSESTKACNLQVATSEFLELDAQAFKCSLAGVVSNDGAHWDETSCARFEELLSDKHLTLTIIAKAPSSIDGSEELTVTLRDSGSSIADILLDGGYARTDICTEQLMEPVQSNVFTCIVLEPESVLDVKFCSGVSPGDFSLQAGEDAGKLDTLMSALPETQLVTSLRVGQAVLVHSKRAVVRAVTEDQCRVKYVDEGTEDTVVMSDMHYLPIEATTLPPQAFSCKMAGVDTESWTQEALDFFEGFKGIDTLSARVVAVENTTHLVYLYDLADPSGVSINSQLVSRGFAWLLPDEELFDLDDSVLSTQVELESSFLEINHDCRSSLEGLGEEQALAASTEDDEVLLFTTPVLAAGEIVELTCLSAKDPHNLVCQLVSYRDQIDDLIKDLNQTDNIAEGAITSLAELHTGDACLAYSVTEGMWHRARVLAKEGDNLAVQFVDFGSSATVSLENIRQIPKTAMMLPAQALMCSMTAVKPTQEQWTEEAMAALRLDCENKAISALVHSVGEDGSLVVSIQNSDGQDVGDMLVAGNYAVREEQEKEVTDNVDALSEDASGPINDEGDDKEYRDEVALSTQGASKKSKSKKKKGKKRK